MNIEQIRDYCLAKKFVEESLPFGEDVLVFKVMGKIFLLCSLSTANSINLKCDPSYAIELREAHSEIQPGYHMNKKMWNTVAINESLPSNLIFQLIDHSYEQVEIGVSKKIRESFLSLK